MNVFDEITDKARTMRMMAEAGYNVKLPTPIGKLIHEPTGLDISVYKPISQFKAFMLKVCFGLKYEKL